MVAPLGDMVGIRTKPKIAESITELIGNTPMLKLGRTAAGLDATILLKLESMEPCNSVKDRIGPSPGFSSSQNEAVSILELLACGFSGSAVCATLEESIKRPLPTPARAPASSAQASP